MTSGFTPLLFAVRDGRIDAVRALLKAGADVNETVRVGVRPKLPSEGAAPMRAGATPLLVAVSNAHFELAAYLLDAGANPNADALGYTALHAIVRVRKPGVGDNDPAPDGSGTMNSIEFVKQLVAQRSERQRADDEAGQFDQHPFQRGRRDTVLTGGSRPPMPS